MKQTYFKILFIAFVTLLSFNSCSTYTSLSNASSISDLRGNPFIKTVAVHVIENTSYMLNKNGLQKNARVLDLNSNLEDILTTPRSIIAFKSMLVKTYRLPKSSVESNMRVMQNIKDVIEFASTSSIFSKTTRY